MKNQRMQICNEFVPGNEAAAGRLFEYKAENLFETMVELGPGPVPGAGDLDGPGDKLELDLGFGGEVQSEGIRMTEMEAGAELDSGVLMWFVWRPVSLYGHFERWCLELGGYQPLHCQGVAGVAEWMMGESLLELTRKRPERLLK